MQLLTTALPSPLLPTGAMAICGLTGGVEAYSLRVALSEVRDGH